MEILTCSEEFDEGCLSVKRGWRGQSQSTPQADARAGSVPDPSFVPAAACEIETIIFPIVRDEETEAQRGQAHLPRFPS